MKKQDLMWTAIPNGVFADASGQKHMRVAVFFSPRLQTNEGLPRPKLEQFPDFLDWPATVAKIQFSLQFAGKAPVAAKRVSYEQAGQPTGSELWKGIFSNTTYVEPYQFPDLSARIIHSFPVRNVMGRVKDVFQLVALESPEKPPRLNEAAGTKLQGMFKEMTLTPQQSRTLRLQMGNQLRGAQLKAYSNPVYLSPSAITGATRSAPAAGQLLSAPGLRTPVAGVTALSAQNLVAAGISQAAVDLQQVESFHKPSLLTAPALPKLVDLVNTTDFHKILASLGQYPELERRLGLVVDLDFPYDAALAGAAWVKVLPAWTPAVSGDITTPRTRCTLSATTFRAATRAAGGEIADGLLDLNNTDLYELGQVDVDGTALKTLETANNFVLLSAVALAPATPPPAVAPPQPAAPAATPANFTLGTGVLRPSLAPLALSPALAGLLRPSDDEATLPATRSAGLWIAKVNRAVELAATFLRAKTLNAAVVDKREADLEMYMEDLVRGYRMDVWDDGTQQWHSLHARHGEYRFTRLNKTVAFEDEGWVSSAAAASPTAAGDLNLHEVMFRWEGWSLSAPRPGKAVAEEGATLRPGGEFGLETDFAPLPRTLPRLRFGRNYRLRVRVVDLAGGGLTLTEAGDAAATPALTYFRYEPLNPPALIPREDLAGSPGESLEHLVIHSFNDAPPQDRKVTDEVTERHATPPPTSEQMAEIHGMFDGADAVKGDATTYQLIADNDGTIPEVFTGPQFDLNYLPDALAYGALLRLRALSTDVPRTEELRVLFEGQWPDVKAFRLVGYEPSAPGAKLEWDAAKRVVRVPLYKAEILELRLNCYTKPEFVPNLGMWRWTAEKALAPALQAANLKPADRLRLGGQLHQVNARPAALQGLAIPAAQLAQVQNLGKLFEQGKHWLTTPTRRLILVHAVQQPLVTPNLANLAMARGFGDTDAKLNGTSPEDGKSTVRVDLEGKWEEPVDSILEPKPRTLPGQKQVADFAVSTADRLLNLKNVPHEFHDTKYRRVRYTARATTRFREYLGFKAADIDSGAKVLTRTSPEQPLDILSSARPAAPKVLYVVPTFAWSRSPAIAGVVSKRTGGGLRVYLERPWFSSGEGELLGVVLKQPRPPTLTVLTLEPKDLDKLTTHWGQDPLWRTIGQVGADPTPDMFRRAKQNETNLFLDEIPGWRVQVSGHEVAYDEDRRLWYCDIELDPGANYWPFLRMALARYQPHSVQTATADCKLSRVVLADFAQLPPDRTATISWATRDPRVVNLSVRGVTYLLSSAGRTFSPMEVTVEQRATLGEGDLGWMPVKEGTVQLQANRTTGADVLWTGQVTLPANRGTQPFRLVIKEYEELAGPPVPSLTVAAAPAFPDRRLVYADAIEI